MPRGTRDFGGARGLRLCQYGAKKGSLSLDLNPKVAYSLTAECYTPPMVKTLPNAATARLEGLSIPVADVERSQAFYTRLGFTTEYQAGKTFALLRIEGGTLGLLRAKVEAGATFRDSVHIELTTLTVFTQRSKARVSKLKRRLTTGLGSGQWFYVTRTVSESNSPKGCGVTTVRTRVLALVKVLFVVSKPRLTPAPVTRQPYRSFPTETLLGQSARRRSSRGRWGV